MSTRRWISCVFAFTMLLCATSLSVAQSKDYSKFDLFGGYSWYHPGGTVNGTDLPDYNAGWGMQFTYNLTHWAGLTLDVGGHYHDGSAHTITAGPQFRLHRGHFSPFAEILVGGARFAPDAAPDEAAFALITGGGIDYKITRRLSIRPIQADFVHSYYNAFTPSGKNNDLNGVRIQAGLVFHFGLTSEEEAAVSASCTAQPSAVDAGAPVQVLVTPSGFSPKRTLSYSYSSTSGTVSGNGAGATVDTAGLEAGNYTVTATVTDNGKGSHQRSASCQAAFAVNAQHPPTLAVSADPSAVTAGESSAITADGNSPDNRPLTYECSSTAGTLSGADQHYTLETTGAAGAITVNCTVTDDRKLSASASTTVTVNAPPPPPPAPQPETKAIEQYLNIRSIYFATDKPTVKNPDRGLLPSQEATLTKLADSFKTYLQSKPDATLILEGHCDQRGSVKYNQALSERRVERTKRLLVDQGVPEASIQTKAFGKQRNLSETEVRNAIDQNPEVSQEDRQKLLKHIKTIVWASNRRVDVTLNVPGRSPQESVQRYPFNAEDSMVLVSPAAPSKKRGTWKKK